MNTGVSITNEWCYVGDSCVVSTTLGLRNSRRGHNVFHNMVTRGGHSACGDGCNDSIAYYLIFFRGGR